MVDLLKMVFLAVVQGLTEFLPVSSSGHLVIAAHVLDFNFDGVTVELLLHVGTLFAVLIYYRDLLVQRFFGFCRLERDSVVFVISIIGSTIPVGLAMIFFNDFFAEVTESLVVTACSLIVTGFILIGTHFIPASCEDGSEKSVGVFRGFLIGLSQVIALFPGLSRSGMTISAARYLGVNSTRAAEFSFIMTIPLILGGCLLDVIENGDRLLSEGLSVSIILVGVFVSAIVGYLSVAIMVKLLNRNRFWLFGFYTLILGATVLCAHQMNWIK